MTPYYERDGITIYCGDNREVLPHIEPAHAVVTDPPYGLSFMGKGWDHSVPGIEFWQAIGEAMLPGAHLLAFGGTRTSHRMAVAIEDAGYEIRDTLQWLYGSGFPKSHDVSKAIDKMAGAEREVTGTYTVGGTAAKGGRQGRASVMAEGESSVGMKRDLSITAPATPEAEQWQGWGTALKPAYEPIIMARKPFPGTVAANVLAHGTGAINVDACRIGTTPEERDAMRKQSESFAGKRWGDTHFNYGYESSMPIKTVSEPHSAGRWPSNVILDEAAAEALDAQSGVIKSSPFPVKAGKVVGNGNTLGHFEFKADAPNGGYSDTGGASRFFYVAKASRRERNAGLEGMPERQGFDKNTSQRIQRRNPDTGEVTYSDYKPSMRTNHHPTVKPLALMRYLIQMVTPPGGIVLDPFAGSGSTLVAAAQLGFHAIGIELSEEYAEIAARRVDHALNERAGMLPLEVVGIGETGASPNGR